MLLIPIAVIAAAKSKASWSTGPVTQYFTYACEHCGGVAPAAVEAAGLGHGPSISLAQQHAMSLVGWIMSRAAAEAACPWCEQVPRQGFAAREALRRKQARDRLMRFPAAALAGFLGFAVTCGIAIVQGVEDERQLVGCLVFAGIIAAISAVTAFLTLHTGPIPKTLSGRVWFSLPGARSTFRGAMGGATWCPARTASDLSPG